MAGEKILIVEDDYKSFKLCRDLLEIRGYRILSAETGREALDMIAAEHPDLILLDVILPDMNGLSIIKLLREKPDNKDIPIIAVTSLAMRNDRMECLEAGCVEHIAKPIDTSEFVDKVEGILKQFKKDK